MRAHRCSFPSPARRRSAAPRLHRRSSLAPQLGRRSFNVRRCSPAMGERRREGLPPPPRGPPTVKSTRRRPVEPPQRPNQRDAAPLSSPCGRIDEPPSRRRFEAPPFGPILRSLRCSPAHEGACLHRAGVRMWRGRLGTPGRRSTGAGDGD
uniref:Uncharacterized protein n=1 Tax=Setaria italica TaxID=4555 RepID=K4ANQ0_SETIT